MRRSGRIGGGLLGALAVGAVIFPSRASAQVDAGIRVGVNFANEIFDPEFFTDTRRGVIVGGAFDFTIDKVFHVVLQPQYTQKGVVVPGALGARTTVKLDYIEFPILLQATYQVGPLMVYAFAGPNAGVLASAVSETVENGKVTTRDAMNKTEGLDIAVDFGAGVGYEMTPTATIVGDIRYSYGISDVTVAKTPTGQPYGYSNNSRDIKIVTGVMFRIE